MSERKGRSDTILNVELKKRNNFNMIIIQTLKGENKFQSFRSGTNQPQTQSWTITDLSRLTRARGLHSVFIPTLGRGNER